MPGLITKGSRRKPQPVLWKGLDVAWSANASTPAVSEDMHKRFLRTSVDWNRLHPYPLLSEGFPQVAGVHKVAFFVEVEHQAEFSAHARLGLLGPTDLAALPRAEIQMAASVNSDVASPSVPS